MQLHRGCLQNINSQEPNHDSPSQQGEVSSSFTLCVMWKDEGQSLSGSGSTSLTPSKARSACAWPSLPHKQAILSPVGPQSLALAETYWLFMSKLLSIPCCTHLRLLSWSFSPKTNHSHVTNSSPAPCVPKGWKGTCLCPCC